MVRLAANPGVALCLALFNAILSLLIGLALCLASARACAAFPLGERAYLR